LRVLSENDARLEEALRQEVSPLELWKHAETLSKWQRLSGTADEAKAAGYVQQTLESCGVGVTVYHFESLLGYPGPASLSVLSPESGNIRCITHPFAAPTSEQGLEGELVDVAGGAAADYEGRQVAGKIVLVQGLASPEKARLAEDMGATAEIFINDDSLHEMCLSPVWGTPIPTSARRLPGTPCISINRTDGMRLKSLLARDTVRVSIKARPRLEWKEVPLVVGEVKGDTDEFVMLSGHICSWYHGAIDNAGANAAMLEIARLLQGHRQRLHRSLRIPFWPGHSQGRYSGSTWYADNFWQDIRRNCVLHLNIDCVGAAGASIYEACSMAETHDLAISTIREVTGKVPHPKRMPRAGDQSFWGIGIPSMLLTLSLVPPEMMNDVSEAVVGGAGSGEPTYGGLPWYWHTPDDTVDKLDKDVLVRDAQVYLSAAFRSCNAPVLPFNYLHAAEEILAVLLELQGKAKGVFDMSGLLVQAMELKNRTAKLQEQVDALRAKLADTELPPADVLRVNRCLKQLGHILIPINYTVLGEFDHDAATPLPPIPGLQPVAQLARLEPGTDSFRFLKTELVRQSNRVAHALTRAIEAVAEVV